MKGPAWTPAAAVAVVLAASTAGVGAGEHESPPRTLVLALDAIPYSVVESVTSADRGEERLFADLKGPVPLVSTFPSTTSLGMPAILAPFGLEGSAGYEAKYFDREHNEIRGGGPLSYHKIKFPWREFFDWEVKGLLRKATTTMRPIKATEHAIEASLDAFFASSEPMFFVYYYTTDPAGHLQGPESFEPILTELHDALQRAREKRPDAPFTTVVFSDHGLSGGPPLANVRSDVVDALRQAGYRKRERLTADEDIVLVPFGLVSSFVTFTRPGHEADAARAMASVDGVDLCAAMDHTGEANVWSLFSGDGEAVVRRRTRGMVTEWSYDTLVGDPLGFAPLAGDSGWRSDSWWFERTATTHYPDALHRIASAFDLVANPASVVCSTDAAHMFGARMTTFGSRFTGRLRWTHGSLLREATMGFVMSDDPDWRPPPAVRFSEALSPFVEPAAADLASSR